MVLRNNNAMNDERRHKRKKGSEILCVRLLHPEKSVVNLPVSNPVQNVMLEAITYNTYCNKSLNTNG